MDRTYKALSLLLCYPTPAWQQTMWEINAILNADARLSKDTRDRIVRLTEGFAKADIYTLEETYVMLFDRSRTRSLNLFEHVHGESRDRGGAMVSLLESYRAAGLEPRSSELPDHLPALLEYLSILPEAEAKAILADAAHIFAAMKTRLDARESDYAAIFDALLSLSGQKADEAALDALLQDPDTDPNDLEALDKVWEESEVKFGPDPNAGCPQVREMLTKIDHDFLSASHNALTH